MAEKDEADLENPPAEAPPPETPIPYSIFTARQKALIVAIVSVASTFSGFASNIYYPTIPTISRDLHVTPELINLTVTSYMILQGLSPTVWGAVADVHGRRVTYICTFIVFISACIGLAETRHYYQLVILRCLQSAGSASTIAIGAGVVGDITTREERGGYMGFYQGLLLAPNAIGPILGGLFSQTLGWRAIFWFLTIAAGGVLVGLILVLPETLRSMVGNGSVLAKGLSNSPLSALQQRRHPSDTPVLQRTLTSSSIGGKIPVDFLGPIKIICSIEVTLVIVFMAISYTVWQMNITVMSTLFQQIYGLSEIQTGLTFIGNGVGCIIGTLTTGKFLDIDYARIKTEFAGNQEDFPLERARLRTLWLWGGLEIGSVLVFGWTLQHHVHISVPIICTFVLGWASTSNMGVVSTFMVDLFPKKSASATAALNLTRCLLGAGGTAAVLPIVNAIGVGWTFTLMAALILGSLGLVLLQMQKGPQWRRNRQMKETLR